MVRVDFLFAVGRSELISKWSGLNFKVVRVDSQQYPTSISTVSQQYLSSISPVSQRKRHRPHSNFVYRFTCLALLSTKPWVNGFVTAFGRPAQALCLTPSFLKRVKLGIVTAFGRVSRHGLWPILSYIASRPSAE